IALAGLVFLGYKYYQTRRTRLAIEPLVQNVTLRTKNDINYDIEPTNITYKEFFERIDKDLAERESKKIDMQAMSERANDEQMVTTLEYMKSCQALLRALESRSYKQLAYTTAIDWEAKTSNQYKNTNSFGRYYLYKTYSEAFDDAKKKEVEYNESIEGVSTA